MGRAALRRHALGPLDPARAEVVVPEPGSTSIGRRSTGSTRSTGVSATADPPVEPGRYPLVGWAFWVGSAVAGRLSRAQAVTHALQLRSRRSTMADGHEGVQRTLDEVRVVMREIEPAAIACRRSRRAREPLVALASAGTLGEPAGVIDAAEIDRSFVPRPPARRRVRRARRRSRDHGDRGRRRAAADPLAQPDRHDRLAVLRRRGVARRAHRGPRRGVRADPDVVADDVVELSRGSAAPACSTVWPPSLSFGSPGHASDG